MRVFSILLLSVCVSCILALRHGDVLSMHDNTPSQTRVDIDISAKSPVSPLLYGIFFEEIGHAGEGGLYAELIQDRSFDALAAVTGFSNPDHPSKVEVNLHSIFNNNQAKINANASANQQKQPTPHSSLHDFIQDNKHDNDNNQNDIIVAWSPLPGTKTSLSKSKPLLPGNPIAMEMTLEADADFGGIMNTGYWGIYIQQGHKYTLTMYARCPEDHPITLTAALTNADGNVTYVAGEIVVESGDNWQQYTLELSVKDDSNGNDNDDDTNGRLVLSFEEQGTVVIDFVSMFPSEHVQKGKDLGLINPWPFRQDLLDSLKDLDPAFIRLPGGCYVEGDVLKHAFLWKNSLGPWEGRPGHYNLWGYWSTDGLGIFEYFQLVEELKAEPVWVINNGVSHDESITGKEITPWVQDALDSIEFITGPPDSKWGAARAEMGHPKPWTLNYMAIGNEDCGKPYYVQNYLAFFFAIKQQYPHMTLIANCNMNQDAPTELWDWHLYTNPQEMFKRRYEFDAVSVRGDPHIFASEYAVTDGGGWGNLIGAVAEAGFMTGMERNAQAVTMGAYAPLFVHTSNRPWPTNMIVIDNHQWYGIPSYYVQKLFRQVQGVSYCNSMAKNMTTLAESDTIAVSSTCQDADCTNLAIKIVNFSGEDAQVDVKLNYSGGRGRAVEAGGRLIVLTAMQPGDENTFDDPRKVYPVEKEMHGLSDSFQLQMKAWSVNIVMVKFKPTPS